MISVKKNRRKAKNKRVVRTTARKKPTMRKRKARLDGTIMDKTLQKRMKQTLSSIDKAMLGIKKKVSSYKKVKKPTWAHLGDLARILTLLNEV